MGTFGSTWYKAARNNSLKGLVDAGDLRVGLESKYFTLHFLLRGQLQENNSFQKAFNPKLLVLSHFELRIGFPTCACSGCCQQLVLLNPVPTSPWWIPMYGKGSQKSRLTEKYFQQYRRVPTLGCLGTSTTATGGSKKDLRRS